MRKLLVCFMFIGMFSNAAKTIAANNTIVISATEWKPYMSQELPNNGFLADITQEVMKHAGYDVKFEFYPRLEAVALLKDGKLDGLAGQYFAEYKLEYLEFPAPITEMRANFFYRKGKEIAYTTIEDLAPYTIGVLKGSSFETRLQKANLKTLAAENLKQNLANLLDNRIDLVIGPTEQVRYVLRDNFPKHSVDTVTTLNPPYQTHNIHVAFSKKHPLSRQLVEGFNTGLNHIRSNGTFSEISRKHGISE